MAEILKCRTSELAFKGLVTFYFTSYIIQKWLVKIDFVIASAGDLSVSITVRRIEGIELYVTKHLK